MKLCSRFQSLDMDKKYSGERWHLLDQPLLSTSSQWTPRTFRALQIPLSHWAMIMRVKIVGLCQIWTFMKKWNHRELYLEDLWDLHQRSLLSLRTSLSLQARQSGNKKRNLGSLGDHHLCKMEVITKSSPTKIYPLVK
uniref:Zinc finger protein 165 n=1 Tax=Molossus molossus TaxID=27622 RepID=A0A7J8CVL1_MOLMO|nr:zinc finger protein 165 [Molossus molossus]